MTGGAGIRVLRRLSGPIGLGFGLGDEAFTPHLEWANSSHWMFFDNPNNELFLSAGLAFGHGGFIGHSDVITLDAGDRIWRHSEGQRGYLEVGVEMLLPVHGQDASAFLMLPRLALGWDF